MALTDRHPDAERLAEFADGVLAATDRVDVERHLADCADCRAVIAETMSFLQAQPIAGVSGSPARVIPFRSRRWVTGVAAGLAAAAAIVFAVRLSQRGDRPELQELIAAVANEPTRPVEGRLTGGFKYAPPPSPTRGSGADEVSPDIRIAAARIEKGAQQDTAGARNALGVAYLTLARFDQAVETLEAAAKRYTKDPKLRSDLSAAYFVRARRRDRAEDLSRALAAAEQALALNPSMPEACVNRVLALDALGLEAASAWRECRTHETDSQWRDEFDRRFLGSSDGR